MGGDIYDVNAEDHSWYAILSFFLFLLPSRLLSLPSLPPFPLHHILFLAKFNPLPCSSSPASRFCGDARRAPPGISAASLTCVTCATSPTQALRARRSSKWISLGAAHVFWYATLVCPLLSLLISPSSFFFSPPL